MDEAPDLHLLQLFEVLYRERHLTRAAMLAGRSQPAMSRDLGRLREVFADPLFVRTARGMVPTARADALAPEVAELLARAFALVTPARFDARSIERTFVIATSDLFEQELTARLVRRIGELAPGINLAVQAIRTDLAGLLESGRVDLVIAPPVALPPGLNSRFLFEDVFMCAARKGHPRVKKKLTLQLFTELPHIQIAPGGLPGGPVDDALAALGLVRRVAVRTPSFLTAPLLAASSDLLLTAPSRVLVPLALPFGLRTFPPPVVVKGFRANVAWHPRAQHDEAHRFFRGLVAELARPWQPK
ncbi:MAG TPA: LysR family transcriptional regulator [Polyangiaceae bacterium]|jgi:DNA-binding transcriptional LysR family regulator|nr:LysR family transcriptional regulator [Polyangiaceae bacterium]